MIICRRCSRRHPDGTEFCTCGAYLEFDGEPTADEPGTATAIPTSEPPIAGVASDQPAADVRPEPEGWSALPDRSAPPRGDTAAVLPAAASRTGGRTEPYVPPTPRPDEAACPSCGTTNPRGSNFCRNCARELGATAQIVAQAPTERRRRFRWPGRRPRLASARRMASPTGMRMAPQVLVFRVIGGIVGAGVLMMLLGVFRGPSTSGLLDGLSLIRYNPVEVGADDVTAVAADGASAAQVEFAYRTPERVVDGQSNTSWATRWTDPADLGEEITVGCQPWRTEQILVVDFGAATDIDRVQVLPGRFADDPARDGAYRPRVLQFALPTARADGNEQGEDQDDESASATSDRCKVITVADDGVLSAHKLSFDDVTTLEVGIISVFEGDEVDSTVEISELVFEQR